MDRLNYIREFTDSKEVRPLFEDVKNDAGQVTGKTLYIEGPFLQGDIENRNGRIYPVTMLERAVNLFKKEKMKGVGAPGELNHPESSIQIDLERVSHYITNLEMRGKDGIGKAKIASTPIGQIAKALITDGLILGVSTRGVGVLNKNDEGKNIVSNFELVTVDIVADPSAPNAFVEAVMEGLQYYKDGKTSDLKLATTMEELIESMKYNLRSLPLKQESKNNKIFSIINSTLDRLK
jgi:hypothetical protein